MAGWRPIQFRKGDRAEYCASYLLSSIAQVVPVPRQEDYGIDFMCALTKADENALYVEDVFGLQVKKRNDNGNEIFYGGKDKSGKWKKHEIFWLVRKPLHPMVIALVNIENHFVNLYSTSNIWYARWMAGNPYKIVLLPDKEISMPSVWYRDAGIEQAQKEQDGHDGNIWSVPLGKPIVLISFTDLENEDYLVKVYNTLKAWLMLDLRNVTHQRLEIPFWERYQTWTTNELPLEEQRRSVMLGNPKSGQNITEILTTLAPMVMSLYFNMHIQNDEGINDIDRIVKMLADRGVLTEKMIFQWASKK